MACDFLRLQNAQNVFYSIDHMSELAPQGRVACWINLDAAAELAAMLLWSERLEWAEKPWLSASRSVPLAFD